MVKIKRVEIILYGNLVTAVHVVAKIFPVVIARAGFDKADRRLFIGAAVAFHLVWHAHVSQRIIIIGMLHVHADKTLDKRVEKFVTQNRVLVNGLNAATNIALR